MGEMEPAPVLLYILLVPSLQSLLLVRQGIKVAPEAFE
jgi:hypothetical protein